VSNFKSRSILCFTVESDIELIDCRFFSDAEPVMFSFWSGGSPNNRRSIALNDGKDIIDVALPTRLMRFNEYLELVTLRDYYMREDIDISLTGDSELKLHKSFIKGGHRG
jgi:hypothetical protein